MATKEMKYERVEKSSVDSMGNMHLKNVSEDRGSEDPGMNFQDKRPAALVPGAPVGHVPEINSSSSWTKRSSMKSSSSSSSGDSRNVRVEEREVSSFKGDRQIPISHDYNTATIVRDVDEIPQLEPPMIRQYATVGYGATGTDEVPIVHRYPAADYGSIGVTTVREAPSIQRSDYGVTNVQVGEQRTVHIPPSHHREEHEVIQHETHSRPQETFTVTIPVSRFESAKMESHRSGVTYTEDKELTIPAPVIAPQLHAMTHNLHLASGAMADIHATTDVNLANEALQVDMGPEEYERYRVKVEQLARQHELETSQKAAAYRNQVEKDAELIRETLERQHIRDIEFRKDMVESAVDRQQLEIQLEAEYAMRQLENEREAARAALEQAMMSTNIEVNIDSAVGMTHSQGKVITSREGRSEVARERMSPTRI